MIPAGTDLKYRVDFNVEGYNPLIDGFKVAVKNRWGDSKYLFDNENALTDTEGNIYITLDAVPSGVYYAETTVGLADRDFQDGRQHIVYKCHLVNVGCGVQQAQACNCQPEYGSVEFTRVYTLNIGDGTYLYDSDGNPIEGSDGQKVRLSMTAQEAKDLLEGRNDNGTIDTIPEVMDALGGMNDSTEYGVMSNDDVDDMMDRIFKNN